LILAGGLDGRSPFFTRFTMAADLVFPRLIYRGKQDILGKGQHVDDDGEIVGETARCESADEFEQKKKDGWRLTSALSKAEEKAADAKADAKDKK
jgi:hypothetical protein